ncbi:MAG: 4-hydroxyacetophenone monooxygenase, partial [Marmoricola sp.]|nr:4-hydroxyacetophenone monooxygenase [Marmoricola sp.]
TDWIVSQVDGRPDLVDKVVPTYPPTGKRTLQDNGSWLRTLTRDHVSLVRSGVSRLTATGVVDDDGVEHPADVVVWATGFRANDYLAPMRVTGRDGLDLHESWGTRPRAHLGITVPGFPNFFMLYGPGTNLASGGSIILATECEMSYVSGCLALLADGHRTLEPTAAAYDAWYEKCQAELRMTVWASPHIEHNYYTNDDGEVHVLNPFRIVDYWAWTREPDLADLDLR